MRIRFSRFRNQRTRKYRSDCFPAAAIQVLENRQLLTLNIAFDYRYDTTGFFASQQRRDVMNAAAAVLEQRIADNLAAISPSGTNTWNAVFVNPTTKAQVTLTDLPVPADTIIVFPGARNLASGLGLGGPGGFSAAGSLDFLDRLQTRDEAGVDPNSTNDTDFAPWGGTIAFDNAVTWNFSLNPPSDGQNDLYSVALHELAHVLGFGTADSFTNKINSSNQFTGASARAAFGGPIPMSEDRFGNLDQGHYASDTTGKLPGTQIQQESAMDPQVRTGTRKSLTDIDWAALNDLGWDVSSVAAAPGNVDGDSDFDSNDSFLMQLVTLASSNSQVDDAKGNSFVAAADIRNAVARLQAVGDVDENGTFDANDAFLIHLIKLSGTNEQIDQFKGGSSLRAAQIRANVELLGGGNSGASQRSASSRSVLAAVHSDTEINVVWDGIEPVIPSADGQESAIDFVFAPERMRDWLAAICSPE